MKTPDPKKLVALKLAHLKAQHQLEFLALNAQYGIVKERLTVYNIVTYGVSEFYKTALTKNLFFTSLFSILGGYVSNQMVVQGSKKIVRKILRYSVQFGVTKFLSKFQ